MDLVVGDEDDRDVPAASHPLHGLQHLELLLLPQGGGRFVEDQHARPEEDGPGDGEGLSLPPGHRSDRLLRIGDVDADLGHLLPGDAVHLRGLQDPEGARPLGDLPPHEEVAGDRGQRIEREVLVDGADPRIGCGERVAEHDGLPVDVDRARGRLVHAGQHLDEGGLSGPVVPEQGVHLAGVDLHRDPAQRREVAEALDDVLEPDERFGHVISPR